MEVKTSLNDELGTGNSQPQSPSFIDCSIIVDSVCKGLGLNGQNPKIADYYKGNDYILPMTSTPLYQTHKYPNYGLTTNQNVFRGESGSEEFSWILGSQFFKNIENGTSMDSIAFTMVDKEVQYSNISSFAEDIGFTFCLQFQYGNDSLEYCGNYEMDNGFCMDVYVGGVPSYFRQCFVGLELQYDFTSFETLEISEFNGGDWYNTRIKISFEDLYRVDGQDFGSTELPFSGSSRFEFGIEHKEVNAKEVGFLIKSGTLLLSFGILLFAIASTPYWDPFKQSFRGVQ